jgi:hypothetical protein
MIFQNFVRQIVSENSLALCKMKLMRVAYLTYRNQNQILYSF